MRKEYADLCVALGNVIRARRTNRVSVSLPYSDHLLCRRFVKNQGPAVVFGRAEAFIP